MGFKASWLRVACVGVVIGSAGWAVSAAAQTKAKYSLSGNGGFWLGSWQPVPITKGVAPNQAMVAIPNATLQQTLTGPDPRQMTICPWRLQGGAALAGTVPNWAPQFANNPYLFQVSTLLTMKFPASSGLGINTPHKDGYVVFKAGGRTGPPTLTWCPGYPPTNPPTCTPYHTYEGVSGSLTYKKTKNQFGGPGQAQVGPWKNGKQQGRVTLWPVPASPPPCKHTVLGGMDPGCFALKGYSTTRAPLLHVGAPFGYQPPYRTTYPPSASPNVWFVWAASSGTLLAKFPAGQTNVKIGPPLLGGFGAPWTTGQLTIVQGTASPLRKADLEHATFTLTGSDARVSGIGNVSLVAGGLAYHRADRGWLNLQVGPIVDRVPSLSRSGMASLGLLLLAVGAAGLNLARRRK